MHNVTFATDGGQVMLRERPKDIHHVDRKGNVTVTKGTEYHVLDSDGSMIAYFGRLDEAVSWISGQRLDGSHKNAW